MITDLAEFGALVGKLSADRKPIGYDVETGYEGVSREKASTHAEENMLVSVQLTNSVDWGRMIPLAFDTPPNVDNRAAAALLWPLFHVLDDEGLPLVVAHGAQGELRWSARWFLANLWDHPLYGRQVIAARGYFPLRSDTMLESYAEGEHRRHGLKAVILDDYGHQMAEIESLFPAGLTDPQLDCIRFNILDQSRPEVIDYACSDAVWCLRYHLDNWPRMRSSFIYKVEMGVLPLVCEMADEGLYVNWAMLRAAAREAAEFEQLFLAEVIDAFSELLGRRLPVDFNFGSADQRVRLFHDWLGLPVVYRTEQGAPSTDAKKALPKLALLCPAVARYALWSKLRTLRNNYMAHYEEKYSWAPDGRAHCLLVQNGAVTGRTSCEKFNYQQAPSPYQVELLTGERFAFAFRDVIQAPPPGCLPWWSLVLEDAGAPPGVYEPEDWDPDLGWYLMGFDYSQIELRVLAAHAGETRLLEAFERGDDVHKLTAALMLGISMDQVTKKQRSEVGKRMNFAIAYQMTPQGLSEQRGIPLDEAQLLFAQWHSAFPRIRPYNERIVRQARREKKIRTKFGRLVRIWEYDNPKTRSKGDRTAGNAVVQGPATGEYVKVAMIRARKALQAAGLADKVRLVMNVHDALEFYVRKDVAPATVMRVLMPAVIYEVKGWPPMVADWHLGTSWGQVREIELGPDGDVRLKRDDAPAPAPVVASARGVVADDVDRGSLAAPAPAAPAPDAERAGGPVPADLGGGGDHPAGGRTIIIGAQQVPAGAPGRLKELLDGLPGDNTVILKVPDGDVTVTGTSGLAPEHEPQVATILPGALVWYDLDSVDTEALAEGLDL
jgi:DNA polymerase I-like protein with 3'-5' exonuclease and polymerase domains